MLTGQTETASAHPAEVQRHLGSKVVAQCPRYSLPRAAWGIPGFNRGLDATRVFGSAVELMERSV